MARDRRDGSRDLDLKRTQGSRTRLPEHADRPPGLSDGATDHERAVAVLGGASARGRTRASRNAVQERRQERQMTWSERLGRVGVWRGVTDVDPGLAKTMEELGYGTIWQGGSPGSDLRPAEELLDATESLHVATGIVNIWRSDPAELADSFHRIEAKHPGRILLGIGSGHREATPERARPIDAMASYLDVLDEHEVPVEARLLSALGPRMLALAAAR